MTTPEIQTARAQSRALEHIEAQGLTVPEFAAAKGLATTTVAGWLRKRTMSLATLVRLANAVGLRPSVLLMSTEEMAFFEDASRALHNVGSTGYSEALCRYLEGE